MKVKGDLMKILDLRQCPENGLGYGGKAGRKVGINIDGQPWIAKYPRTTRDLQGHHLPSYTSSPVSEYLGSHIYQSLGIDAHETKLGYRDGKIVCACRDFTWPDKRLIEFKSIKNGIPDELDGFIKIPSDGDSIYLSDILSSIDISPILSKIRGVLDRFWDMFVVDAFLNNPIRINENWGTLRFADGHSELAPVYDNGSCLFSKRSASFVEETSQDTSAIKQDVITDVISCYRLYDSEREQGRIIHPFKYMLSTDNPDLDHVIERFMHHVNMREINHIIDDVPEEAFGTVILPNGVRESHKTLLQERITRGFIPTYKKILTERPENLLYSPMNEWQLNCLASNGAPELNNDLQKALEDQIVRT